MQLTRTLTKTAALTAVVALSAFGPRWAASAAEAASGPTCDGKAATIVGTDGQDTIIGTPGDDVIVGLRGWDTIRGAGGNDTICGGKGADHLYGGTGNDWLDGEADGLLFDEDEIGDHVDGGLGNDVVSGGGGLEPGDRGLDVLVYPSDVGPLHVDLLAGTAELASQHDRVFNVEYVQGTEFADVLLGDNYFNSMAGLGGNDVVVGRGGVDFLDGDDGNDHVSGGSGNDGINGGAGTDVGDGGTGDDFCFLFESTTGCEHT